MSTQNWDEKWQSTLWIASQEDRNSSLVSIADLFNDSGNVYDLLLTTLPSSQNPEQYL